MVRAKSETGRAGQTRAVTAMFPSHIATPFVLTSSSLSALTSLQADLMCVGACAEELAHASCKCRRPTQRALFVAQRLLVRRQADLHLRRPEQSQYSRRIQATSFLITRCSWSVIRCSRYGLDKVICKSQTSVTFRYQAALCGVLWWPRGAIQGYRRRERVIRSLRANIGNDEIQSGTPVVQKL